ncbi:MAG: hypothetical protein IPP97_00290 [Candidatus Obscuribacter sp.]|nr:hypothetical protein [Candidatus Obscuribacter sp.]MBP6350903.1 hypothetical protein [Candidatus Obscuribacter sp.]MBP6595085.1 hypothetical protein [Candidatus Obscuribacter sp.]MBP7578080.1 hypothetical protein [Candidatus Obscuribacter sp.]
MKFTFYCFITYGLLLISTLRGQCADESWPYRWSRSSADSKKIRKLLCLATVTPRNFDWQGHKVEVYDSWFEKSGTTYYLMFKLKVDGSSSGEYALEKKQHAYIGFVQDNEDGSKGIDFYGIRGKGLLRHEVVHYLRMFKVPKPEIVLKVLESRSPESVRLRFKAEKGLEP